jgi:hypothetical protein
MVAAVALREQNAFETQPSRSDVLARYRHLRDISKRHASAVLKFLSGDAIFHQARRLGLARGKMLVLDDMDEMNYAFDLAIHTAPTNRSRAIDRYSRSARLAPGSDEALVLDAMCHARFSVVRMLRRHETAGLIVEDLFRRKELWLVDVGLESSVPAGALLATRLYTPERFAMTGGANVPFDREMMAEVVGALPQLGRKPMSEVVDDRRFAEAIYRIALAGGVMERVRYQDPL